VVVGWLIPTFRFFCEPATQFRPSFGLWSRYVSKLGGNKDDPYNLTKGSWSRRYMVRAHEALVVPFSVFLGLTCPCFKGVCSTSLHCVVLPF